MYSKSISNNYTVRYGVSPCLYIWKYLSSKTEVVGYKTFYYTVWSSNHQQMYNLAFLSEVSLLKAVNENFGVGLVASYLFPIHKNTDINTFKLGVSLIHKI